MNRDLEGLSNRISNIEQRLNVLEYKIGVTQDEGERLYMINSMKVLVNQLDEFLRIKKEILLMGFNPARNIEIIFIAPRVRQLRSLDDESTDISYYFETSSSLDLESVSWSSYEDSSYNPETSSTYNEDTSLNDNESSMSSF